MRLDSVDTTIATLGPPKITSPIRRHEKDSLSRNFVHDSDRILVDVNLKSLVKLAEEGKDFPAFELAGPRSKIYFDPSKLRCALVTCGGLCPGLNDIIRAIVLELFYGYEVRNIYGFRYGLQGFIPKYEHDVIDLKPEIVVNIHEMGGSILGSSRGPQPVDEIVDTLERMNIGILFMIGGDGTLMAATKIADAISQRNLKISVVGIPKTIDNDIYMVSRSFGFHTAVDVATQAIKGAHNESEGYPNGIGLIKLMGRHSGFIAATAVLAQQDVNFVLIPEVDFDFEGPYGLLSALEKRGNPWGKMEKKRIEWTRDKEFAAQCRVKLVEKGETADTLYFVDSISSYDDRMQDIGRATARILHAAGEDFGILGKDEKDSGHEVRRFGEEMLFQDLRDQNTEAIRSAHVKRIVTAALLAFSEWRGKQGRDLDSLDHGGAK